MTCDVDSARSTSLEEVWRIRSAYSKSAHSRSQHILTCSWGGQHPEGRRGGGGDSQVVSKFLEMK